MGVYEKYKQTVNMSFSELLKWGATNCSKKASLNRSPIRRNLILLSKPKSKWSPVDIKNANKTIAFISRMKKVKPGKIIKGCGLSKRDISLKNWAYNPKKKIAQKRTKRKR